jgi:IS30 family transposase
VVVARLVEQWSPEQIAGRLRKSGELCISHETIYRRIWEDRRRGGHLYLHLRGAQKSAASATVATIAAAAWPVSA